MKQRLSRKPGGSSRNGRPPFGSKGRKSPEIKVTNLQHGIFEQARRLNPRFVPDRPLLVVTLEIGWAPREPRKAIAILEEKLLRFAPGLRHHQCRGPDGYVVFSASGRGNGVSPSDAKLNAPGARERGEPYDPGLALAHLLEHVIIDSQCSVTGELTCSGVTGAHRSASARYDVLVECRELPIGCCCLALAVGWFQSLLQGGSVGEAEKESLSALKWIHRHASGVVFSTGLARFLGWSEERAERALATLYAAGYLEAQTYGVNLSGLMEYRRRGDPESAAIPSEGGLESACGAQEA
jgi:hypothetical protein